MWSQIWQHLDLLYLYLGLYYLGGPLAVYLTVQSKAKPNFIPQTINDFPIEAQKYQAEKSQELADVGYHNHGYFYSGEVATGVDVYVGLFQNRSTSDLAMTATMYTQKDNKLKNNYTEILAIYRDESSLTTNNSRDMMAFFPHKTMVAKQFPQINDVKTLHQAHQILAATLPFAASKKSFEIKDPVAFLQECNQRVFQKQIEHGFFYHDQKRGSYHPTIKGALLMTWRLAFPMGNLVKMRIRFQGNRILSQIQT